MFQFHSIHGENLRMRLSNTLGRWSDFCDRSVLGEVGDRRGCVGEGVEENATILCPRHSNAVSRVVSNTHYWCAVTLEEGKTILNTVQQCSEVATDSTSSVLLMLLLLRSHSSTELSEHPLRRKRLLLNRQPHVNSFPS